MEKEEYHNIYLKELKQIKTPSYEETTEHFKNFETFKREIFDVLKKDREVYAKIKNYENDGFIDYKILKKAVKNVLNSPKSKCPKQKLSKLEEEAESIKNTIVESHLKLVPSVIRCIKNIMDSYDYPFDDAIQNGNLGLIRAVEKYNYRQGYKFSTYAFWWIMQSVVRGYAEYDGIIRLPIHFREDLKKFKAAIYKGVTPESFKKEWGITKETLECMLIYFSPIILYLDMPLDGDSRDSKKILYKIQDNRDPPYLELYKKELKIEINHILKTLDPVEENIIKMRFGIDVDRKTLREVGEMFDLSRERIRQIEKEAIKKLKRKAKQHLRDFR